MMQNRVDSGVTQNGGDPPRQHVVAIITHFDPGGAQHAIMSLSRELRSRGHSVELWGLYSKAPPGIIPPDAKVLLNRSDTALRDYALIFYRLLKELRAVRPDAVVAFLPLACVMGLFGARLLGVRSRVASQRNPSWTYNRPMRILDKLVGSLGFYTSNVANSHSVKESFNSYPRPYRRLLTVVYNGVLSRPSVLQPMEARQKFGLPEKVTLIVTIGRLSEQKNQALLLDMLVRLSDVHLVLAGDGPLRERFEARANDLGLRSRTHFLGTVENEQVPDLLRATDIFALPSLYEGQSNALLEAMSAGLPILASDIPPQAELICGDHQAPAGRILPVNDPLAWARTVQELVENLELRNRLTASARARAAAFTFERMADGFEHAICRSLGATNGRSP